MVDELAIVEVFVCRDEKCLILQRAGGRGRGWWATPGGMVEPGEDAASAAVRETLEETGLAIERVQLVRRWRFRLRNDSYVRAITSYIADAPAGDVRLSAEHVAYDWMTPSDYAERFCSEELASIAPDYAHMFRETRATCAEIARRLAASTGRR